MKHTACVRWRSLLAMLVVVATGACSDERQAEHERSSHGAEAPHKVAWLDVSSTITPGQWLASRKDDKPKPVNHPEVQRIARQLATAHGLYRESERMIANRSAQVSEMLDTHGIRERPTDILDGLTGIAGEVGQTEGFGAVSQHYFNLRVADIERGEALATLKARYGPRQ
ncbi:hypothetical protein [Hyphomicrobium sp.]|uniref:hypothetical protein n=1 Tax=Hyphomicrobium sp. TaxID=82 RepID=UPI002E358399|nr:hypothetical protein [Hyphomicrobium sp.]HEX2842555.1 hypothetical protein [Hyphomicrobium sp.]